jgi:hypothetical protein
MNVEIGAEAALFPEKEYINGIAVAVQKKDMMRHPPCSVLSLARKCSDAR